MFPLVSVTQIKEETGTRAQQNVVVLISALVEKQSEEKNHREKDI